MKFVIDVGVGRSVEMQLTADGHEALPVRERNPHTADADIMSWAHQEQAIVVTMDKDFGDLIWKERLPHAGVILLRMEEASGTGRGHAPHWAGVWRGAAASIYRLQERPATY